MTSEIEKIGISFLTNFRSKLKEYDRAVVIGAALSLTPIFPACLFGFFLSVLNFSLLKRGRLLKRNYKLVIVSLIFSLTFTTAWGYLLYSFELAIFMDFLKGGLKFFLNLMNVDQINVPQQEGQSV